MPGNDKEERYIQDINQLKYDNNKFAEANSTEKYRTNDKNDAEQRNVKKDYSW